MKGPLDDLTPEERLFLRQMVQAAMTSRAVLRFIIYTGGLGMGVLAAGYYALQIVRSWHALRNGQ